MYDGANAAGTDDAPNEEGDAANGCDDGFDGEEMSYFVYGEPDEGKRAEPEDEEGNKIVDGCSKGDRLVEGGTRVE